MMTRNERTPRTLADCSWQTGYASAQLPRDPVPAIERIAGVLLAVAIGVFAALLLAHGLNA